MPRQLPITEQPKRIMRQSANDWPLSYRSHEREYELDREQYLDTFKPLRDQAIQISDITRAAYNEGGLDLVRLLDAERVRIEAEVSWVGALESYHQSVVALEYAEGVQTMNFLLAALWIGLEIACFGCGRQTAEELSAKTSVPSTPGEVVISPVEQAAQKIEVQTVQMRDLPSVAQFAGTHCASRQRDLAGGRADGWACRKGICEPRGLRAQGGNSGKNAQP